MVPRTKFLVKLDISHFPLIGLLSPEKKTLMGISCDCIIKMKAPWRGMGILALARGIGCPCRSFCQAASFPRPLTHPPFSSWINWKAFRIPRAPSRPLRAQSG